MASGIGCTQLLCPSRLRQSPDENTQYSGLELGTKPDSTLLLYCAPVRPWPDCLQTRLGIGRNMFYGGLWQHWTRS